MGGTIGTALPGGKTLDPAARSAETAGIIQDDAPGGAHLRLCDACCDKSGTLKEMVKTGGCTCDVCGFACACCGGDGRQFVNRVLARNIPAEGWLVLQERNRKSLAPLDWETLFCLGRE